MTSRAIRFAAPMGAAPGGQGDRRGSDATKRRSSRLRAQRLPQHVGHGRAVGQGSKRLAVTFVDPALAPLVRRKRARSAHAAMATSALPGDFPGAWVQA